MNSKAVDTRSSLLGIPSVILWIAGAILAWFVVSEAATEVWYRWKESQVPVTQAWPIDWPTKENAAERGFRNFQPREMTDVEKELLRFDRGRAASWHDAEGNQWTGFYIEWEADKKLNQMDITHNPTACLSGAGLRLEEQLPEVEVQIGDSIARFKAWKFSANGVPVFVYVGTRLGYGFSTYDYKRGGIAQRTGNLWKAMIGSRGNPLQTVELVLVGKQDAEAAEKAFRHQFQHLL